MKTINVKGNELQVGDVLHVWWNLESRGAIPNRDVITKLEPYNGSLKHIFKDGAQIASFVYNKTGMTIENNIMYTVDRKNIDNN